MMLPNGLAFDEDGNLFVSDSMTGTIFMVLPNGDPMAWIQHDLLTGDRAACGSAAPDFDVDVNGIAFDDAGDLWAVNTHKATVIRIPVNGNGSAGTPELRVAKNCEDLEGANGVAFDSKGNLYVVIFLNNKLVKVSDDNEVTLLDPGSLLNSPASLVFGPRGDGRETLFISNFAFVSATSGGSPAPGVPQKEIGLKGLTLNYHRHAAPRHQRWGYTKRQTRPRNGASFPLTLEVAPRILRPIRQGGAP
jgi:DNA-binding beta-propeller fold protein YncE